VSGYSFDANILIDALLGRSPAHRELERAAESGGAWMSRMAWIEVMSKGRASELREMEEFLSSLFMDDIDEEIASRAAALRRDRPKLRSPDAIIFATAQVRGRILVTRNIRDFPGNMPGIRVPYTL
jgi:predicted nucleic acid-binding protein